MGKDDLEARLQRIAGTKNIDFMAMPEAEAKPERIRYAITVLATEKQLEGLKLHARTLKVPIISIDKLEGGRNAEES